MHRDLKPSNILQRENGVWVITDFGLAAKADEDYLWKTCGTPGFVAPEILRSDEKYGQACDMFSLGVIGYIMVLGQRPFPGKE
jgi:serine/threonine protein kinase